MSDKKHTESFSSVTAVAVTITGSITLLVGILAAIVFWIQAGAICSYYCDRYEEIEKANLINLGFVSSVGSFLTATLFFALAKITQHLAKISHRLELRDLTS